MNRLKHHNRSMLEGPLLSGIIAYTIPIMLTSILQLLFNAADLVIVGRYCGSISVAAVSATGAITNLIVNLFIGLSVGTGVAVAHGLGGNRPDDVHRTVHTALPMALSGGIVLTLVGVLFADDFLRMMNTPENVLPLSTVYMRIYFGGITFSLVYNFCASILRAAGDTKSPLYFLSLAGVINVGLNVLFVTVFDMNVAGVALATTISQGISAILSVVALTRRTDSCKLVLKQMRFYGKQLLKIIRIGLPAGIQSSLFSISNVLIQSSINSFDNEILISGNGAAINIEGFVYIVTNSIYQTTINYVGQNTGAHQFQRVKKIFWTCLGCTTVAGLVAGMLVHTFGRQLLSIYLVDSVEAVNYGLARFNIVCITYFLCGMMEVSTGTLRGLGSSFTPMLISVLGVCGIRVVWVLTVFQIPAFRTPESLYVTYPISWIVTFLVQTLAFVLVYRKKVRSEQNC